MKKNNPSKGGFKAFLKARTTRRGALSIVFTALFIAAIVLVNIILSAVTDRTPLYLDVTQNASYKLHAETTDFTATITKPVDIYVLQKETDFESGDSNNYKYYVQANKLIHAIADSSDKITLHYEDITANPTFTADYPQIDWTRSHIALVVSGDLYRAVDLTDMFTYDQEQYYYYGTYVITKQNVEQALVTAMMNVTAEDKTKVMLLSGQGEQEMSAFTTLLENNAYEVETVSLLTGEIPEDAEFIVIFDPDVDISTEVYTALTSWLNNDGKFGHHLVYFPNDQHDTADFVNLNALIGEYGMAVENGYIYENDDSYLIPGYNHYISVYDYAEDDTTYTASLRNANIPVVMTMTMPVTITDTQTAKPLLTSSDKSFFFPRGLDEESAKEYEPEFGSLNGAAIGARNDGTEDGKSSTVAVIGSYDAMTASFLSIPSYNNAAYFINLFNTLSDREDVSVVIEGKDPSANALGVTSVSGIMFPSILVRFIIPIAVLIAGLIVWIRRRHQ